ncbi:MAG: beta-lactamase family protein [Flavobacteriales bacterium]|nr:beta-lactamase family protein [Flavobacteriales bacterium]
MKKICLYIAVAMAWCHNATGQQITDELDGILNDFNLVGMAAAATCNGYAAETYYGGVKNIDSGAPLDENTYFRVASISKSFSAAALLRLHESGAFELGDDIGDALPYEVRNPNHPATPITYRMLMSHTASLQDGGGYSDFLSATVSTDNPPDMSEILLPGGNFYTANMWRLEQPGTHFAYSNMTYGLVGTLVEIHAGMRFDQYLKQEVLEPLGIAGSFNVADIEDIENLSPLYRNSIAQVDNFGDTAPTPFENEGYVPGTNGSRFGPQGGLRTNLDGLMRFGNMLANYGAHGEGQFLDSALVAEMLGVQWTFTGNNGDNFFGLFNSWGLGIHRSLGITGNESGDAVFPDTELYGHPGEAYGLISDLYVHPETGFVMAFLTNGYTVSNNYAFGATTTFYAVEEAVFDAFNQSAWQDCQNSLSTSEEYASTDCKGLYFDQNGGRIQCPSDMEGVEAELFGIQGQTVWKGRLQNGQQFETSAAGIYVLRTSGNLANRAGCTLKLAALQLR